MESLEQKSTLRKIKKQIKLLAYWILRGQNSECQERNKD